MPETFVLAIDQGTTGSTVLLFDRQAKVVGRAYREVTQHYPEPGWVEHDATEIWEGVRDAIGECLRNAGVDASAVAGIGITNQRETTVMWDRRTGKPVHRAIVWQCRRTAAMCDALTQAGHLDSFAAKTGLLLDAYFSGTKVSWLLDHVPGLRVRAEAGEIAFGTIDSWLIWNLTGGQRHATDASNASRTLLFNLNTLDWDPEILATLRIPQEVLPEVVPNSGVIAKTAELGVLPAGIPIAGSAGDQQAALFGQRCFKEGQAKNTYGTGCFLLLNTGSRPVFSQNRLLTTIAWQIGDQVSYALEGSIFMAGATVHWLRDQLGIIQHASETEAIARSLSDNGGVYLVPAFVGLGAPQWDAYARGSIVGLTRGTGKAHLVRAALEAMAYQTRDLVTCMEADTGKKLEFLSVDGGAAANGFIMEFVADMLDVPVLRGANLETTALGAALLAGLGIGFWSSLDDLPAGGELQRFSPRLAPETRERLYADWLRAVERAEGWVQPEAANWTPVTP
ncbi:Glycerol kinase [compost metagenome]